VTPRVNLKAALDKYRLFYWDDEAIELSDCEADTYWNERGAAVITPQAEYELLGNTYELHNMCLEAVDKVVKNDTLLEMFMIPRRLWKAVKKSWAENQMDFVGRFDFAWDGKGPAKLLEYNADTPSLLIESGPVQAEW